MFLKVYTIHDSKVGAFMAPFFMRSEGEALRAFEQAVNDPATQFNKTPADFTLFFVGEFNDADGYLSCCTPQSVAQAISVMKRGPDVDQAKVEILREGLRGVAAEQKQLRQKKGGK